MPVLGAPVAPLWSAGAPPALIYNLVLLAALSLNGVFCYRLLKALRLPTGPALAGAVLAVNLPFVGKVMGVLPNVALFGMFWTLEGLVRFADRGSAGWAAWAGAGVLATYLSFQQYALFFAPLAVVAGLVALSGQGFRRPAALRLAGCAAAAAGIVVLVALPALRLHSKLGLQRSDRLVRSLSARPGDFLSRASPGVANLPRSSPADTAGLFPGFVLGGLALVGATVGRGEDRRWATFFTAGAVAGVVLAMGLNLSLFGWRPFRVLRWLPGMAEVRSPYRAAAIFQLCLVPLAAWGLVVAGRLAARRRTLVVGGLVAVAVVESLSLPPLVAVARTPRTAWTTWLRHQPPGSAVAHVPFPAGFTVGRYEVEARRMFAQIDHHQPLVNGYSGYFPVARGRDGRVVQAYLDFQLQMALTFPNDRLLCVLVNGLHADLLAVDTDWLAGHQDAMSTVSAFLRPAYEDRGIRIYRMSAPADRCADNR
ncbi:MAG: hypothetical protein LC792_14945 [Actinobacteria bacterium]|nr:hypothetical protein [Actinomycetota bacterium]